MRYTYIVDGLIRLSIDCEVAVCIDRVCKFFQSNKFVVLPARILYCFIIKSYKLQVR